MRVPGVVAEHTAQFLNTRGERVVADCHTSPDALDQVLLGDEFLSPLGQKTQHRGRPRRQLDLAAVAPKLPGSRVETKQAKRDLPLPSAMRPLASAFPGIFPELHQDFLDCRNESSHTRSQWPQSAGDLA